MPRVLDPKGAHDLITRGVTTLAGGDAAKRVSPAVEAAFELARQTVNARGHGKHEVGITFIKVSVRGGANHEDGKPVTTMFDQREPIDAGPKPRVPIRVGGGTCFTIKTDKGSITICIEWESA
jgi:hypothetical protein